MKIIYIGQAIGTSAHRLAAMRRLGHEVQLLDPASFLPNQRAARFWMWHLGSVGLAEHVRRRVVAELRSPQFDLAWVDHGPIISAECVKDLRRRIPKVVCYNLDDPFGERDGSLWRQYREAVPYYDLLVVVRETNVKEAYNHGAKEVMLVYRSADDVAHAPRILDASARRRWGSEVMFAGTAFPERGEFMKQLIHHKVPLAVYGDRWKRLKQWKSLKVCWRGPALSTDEGYGNAISAAKVCLGLLSKENRDLHTTRTMEIPALGGLLCAERTSEHTALYDDGKEAVFWADPEECAETCHSLLRNDDLRRSIAARGHERFKKNGWTNTNVIESVLRAAVPAQRLDPDKEDSARVDGRPGGIVLCEHYPTQLVKQSALSKTKKSGSTT